MEPRTIPSIPLDSSMASSLPAPSNSTGNPERSGVSSYSRLQRSAANRLSLQFDAGLRPDVESMERGHSFLPAQKQRTMSIQSIESCPITPDELHSLSPYSPVSHSPISSASTATFDSAPPTPSDTEDSWNLIPYNVPWGSSYHQYEAGTLPGPDGACIFLRSPTPLKNQRTTQACEKCRERKAKCSGDRPSCARCIARGHTCTYVSDPAKRVRGANLNRLKRRDTISTCSSTPDLSDSESNVQARRNSEPDIVKPANAVKREGFMDSKAVILSYASAVPQSGDGQTASTPEPLDDHPEAWSGYGYADAQVHDEPNLSTGAFSHSVDYDISPLYTDEQHQCSEQAMEYEFSMQPSIYAPRPVRHSVSMSFLPQSPQSGYYISSANSEISVSSSHIAISPLSQHQSSTSPPILTSPVNTYTLASFEHQQPGYYATYHPANMAQTTILGDATSSGYVQCTDNSPMAMYGDNGSYNDVLPSSMYSHHADMPSFAQPYLSL